MFARKNMVKIFTMQIISQKVYYIFIFIKPKPFVDALIAI